LPSVSFEMVTTDARDGEPQKISVRRQAFCSKDDLAMLKTAESGFAPTLALATSRD